MVDFIKVLCCCCLLRLKFTVVSEPPENMADTTEMECEDVGVAYVDMKKILETGKNLKDHNINRK